MNTYPTKGPGDFGPPDDDARDEWIAERADELTAERMKLDPEVRATLADLLMHDDIDETVDALRRFVMADDRAHAGDELHEFLSRWVRHSIHQDAESDAATEWDKREAADALARDEQQDVAREIAREW